MKINKADFKDALTFLWISIVFFLVTLDVAFGFVMFVMKVLFLLIGILMMALGIGTIIRSISRKKTEEKK